VEPPLGELDEDTDSNVAKAGTVLCNNLVDETLAPTAAPVAAAAAAAAAVLGNKVAITDPSLTHTKTPSQDPDFNRKDASVARSLAVALAVALAVNVACVRVSVCEGNERRFKGIWPLGHFFSVQW
jgi:hypothetical protein